MNDNPVIVSLLILGAGVIALEFGVSVAILEIIAGIVAGNFFNAAHFPWVEFLADFGLLGLMFFAGFEVDGPLLKKTWRKSLRIGIISFLFPLLAVFGASLLFGFNVRVALLIAIGLSTTSLALVYAVLKERGILEQASSQIILSSSMVLDVLSMIALSLLFEGVTMRSVIFVIGVLVALWVLPWVGRLLLSRYEGDSIEFGIRFIFLLLLALGVAAEAAQVHVAILAFVAGFLFTHLMTQHEVLEQKLRGVIFGLFAPIFFFSAGSSIVLADFGIGTVALIAALGAVVFIGKYLASNLAFRKYFKNAVPRLGGLLFNFQLSFGIIVAVFGLRHGLIDSEVYNAMLGVIVVLAILSEVLVRNELKRADAAAAIE